MQNAINIEGDKYAPETLKAITDAIVRILECNVEQKTKRKALETFSAMASRHLHISGCHINGGGTHTHYHTADEDSAESEEPEGFGSQLTAEFKAE